MATTVTFEVPGQANLYQQTNPETVLGSIDPVKVPNIRLKPGQSIEVTAIGCAVSNGPICVTPDGYPELFRGLPVYSLIGRWSHSPDILDNSTVASDPFYVGSFSILTVPSEPGDYYLFLGENDGGFSDNAGSFTVTATSTLFKKGVSSNSDICPTHLDWCANPTFDGGLGMTSNSDIPINLINASYIVDGFSRTVVNGKATITANLYNRGYADAMLDIYDKQGNWTGFISLDGNRPETSIVGDIWDKWTTTYDSYVDEYSSFDPRDSVGSERLSVSFTIPRGGYAALSKNSTSALANTVLNNALAIFGEQEWIKQSGKTNKVKLLKIVINEVINQHLEELVSQLKAATDKNNQVEAENITRQILEKVSSISYVVFVDNSETVMRVIGNNKAKRFAKKAAKFFSPLGKLIEAAEKSAMALSVTGQLIDIAKASNDRAVYFK